MTLTPVTLPLERPPPVTLFHAWTTLFPMIREHIFWTAPSNGYILLNYYLPTCTCTADIITQLLAVGVTPETVTLAPSLQTHFLDSPVYLSRLRRYQY